MTPRADEPVRRTDPWHPDLGFRRNSGRLGSGLGSAGHPEPRGKIVALYGMGDQLGYGEWFLDALGMLHDKLATKGVKFVGYWPTEGYEFTSPKPVIADGQLFVGLALDETNQYDLSDERIQSWCEQILGEMAEHFS